MAAVARHSFAPNLKLSFSPRSHAKALGAAIAEALAAEGARVVVSARNADRLARMAADIAARTGGEVRAVPADVTDARAVDRLVAEADSRHGGIDVLVANSGGAATAPFAEMTDDGWRAAMEVKVLAQIRLAREAFKRMTARGAGGRIVFVAGTHGRQPHAHAVTAGFCNAALQNVSKALAEEGGRGDGGRCRSAWRARPSNA